MWPPPPPPLTHSSQCPLSWCTHTNPYADKHFPETKQDLAKWVNARAALKSSWVKVCFSRSAKYIMGTEVTSAIMPITYFPNICWRFADRGTRIIARGGNRQKRDILVVFIADSRKKNWLFGKNNQGTCSSLWWNKCFFRGNFSWYLFTLTHTFLYFYSEKVSEDIDHSSVAPQNVERYEIQNIQLTSKLCIPLKWLGNIVEGWWKNCLIFV